MIKEKGVYEFVNASQEIYKYNNKIKFLLVGNMIQKVLHIFTKFEALMIKKIS